jgi:hypothetical protein
VIRVNKADAACRQISAAIRMSFAPEDPIAVHCVAAAGFQIVRDLCDVRSDILSYERMRDWIKPGHEAAFWRAINRTGSFLKHADRDPHAIHEMEEGETDFAVIFASKLYHDLGFRPSQEMNVFATWFALCNPNSVTARTLEIFESHGVSGPFIGARALLEKLPRAARLAAGNELLKQAHLRPTRNC